MDRRKFLFSLAACPACASAAMAESAAPHWEYEGERGVAKWGELDSRFKACAVGSEQSPIDLTRGIRAKVEDLSFNWKPQAFDVINNGHTIQANVEDGSALAIGKTTYGLKQFHFHTPSEHAIGGKRTAMEAHFVHATSDGRLAVVGVLMIAGAKHKAFSEIMQVAPKKEGEAKLKAALDPRSFLLKSRHFYRYEGSLTTPPCSEIVDWNVFEKTIEVAAADIEAFRAVFPMNARPLQEINRRFLLRGL
ncbi:carbonic anhydrase family protein [Bosea sp. (in: a-proteobacteria)]|uniref:carbonic anhydrase n=1 Tax=Bosea sp. (in: a-proteobacteria) TaxID=1871050 RepID=UPI002B46A399|nr:carbonic anhydrase family protein [Bosea sp. (in: a-proteobacteria)]WRH59977.1 MAG: carbonic anhydrase family protein [Bosea sp. (in: a-proteobacteria)]